MMDKVDGMPARYLGYGVYAVFTGYTITLRANDHRPEYATDTIRIEPDVLKALNRFHEDALKEVELSEK